MSLQIGLQKNIILDDISCKIETPYMHSVHVHVCLEGLYSILFEHNIDRDNIFIIDHGF
jgi:hypothetical protein